MVLIPGGGDLSFNTIYTFTITPYNILDISGKKQTIDIDTTPKVTGSIATNSTASNTQLQWKWCGNSPFSYVNIQRQITAPYTTYYVDVSKNIISSEPYYDLDLSGNTTYIYKITPYTAGDISYSDISNTLIYTSNAQAARDLSLVFVDTSSIKIQFTAPKNSYSSSYYYQLDVSSISALDMSSSISLIKSITGGSPLMVTGLSAFTSYSCYISTYLDNALNSTSNKLNIPTPTLMYTHNGRTFANYVFTEVDVSYQITFNTVSTIYLLLVGGGGAGNSGTGSAGGAGGGGGVYTSKSTIQDNETLTIRVGKGGVANSGKGQNTTVTFSKSTYNSSKTITACGGGGAAYGAGISISTGNGSGGSGSSGSRDGGGTNTGNAGTKSGDGSDGTKGGTTGTGYSGSGGGGGALSAGGNGAGGSGGLAGQKAGSGGSGKRCDMSYNNSYVMDYTYYWGGGGGGSLQYDLPMPTTAYVPGKGGLGGGGGGTAAIGGNASTTGSTLYKTVTNGYNGTSNASYNTGANGGINTGGGGGGGYGPSATYLGGNGGSGIVIISVYIYG